MARQIFSIFVTRWWRPVELLNECGFERPIAQLQYACLLPSSKSFVLVESIYGEWYFDDVVLKVMSIHVFSPSSFLVPVQVPVYHAARARCCS